MEEDKKTCPPRMEHEHDDAKVAPSWSTSSSSRVEDAKMVSSVVGLFSSFSDDKDDVQHISEIHADAAAHDPPQEDNDRMMIPSIVSLTSQRVLLVDNYDSFTYNLYQVYIYMYMICMFCHSPLRERERKCRTMDGLGT